MMKLGILVGHIKSELERQKKLAIEPSTTQGDKYDIHLEAQKTLRELDAVIKQLEGFNSEQDVTLDHIKIITDFFEKRWERIKSTDVIYNINTESHVNALCVYIAKYLAEQRDLVMKRNYLALLMPTIKSWHNDASHQDLWTLYLHNFIPSDDNESCIQMGYVDLSLEGASKLLMSCKVGGDRTYLSDAEANRVYHHSTLIADFYDLIKAQQQEALKKGSQPQDASKRTQDQIDAARKVQEAIQKARDNMVKALRDEQYGKRTVQSTYGVEGRDLLKKNLLKDLNDLFTTREQLFDFMTAKLEPFEWKGFLAKMDDSEKLLSLLLKGETIDQAIKSNALFKKIDKYDRVVSFCLVEAYWRIRDAEGDYTSYSGRLFGFPKVSKEKVVEIMRKFLSGTIENGSDYSKYFAADKHDGLANPQLSSDEHVLLGAMKDGTVGHIYERIRELFVPVAANVDVNLASGAALAK